MNFDQYLKEHAGPIMRDEERDLARKSNLTLDRHKMGKWTVWARTHAAARAYQRLPDVSKEQWSAFTKSVIEKVDTFDRLTKEKEFIFHSKQHDLGYVAAVDPVHSEVRIISVLEPGKTGIRKAGTTWVQLT